ncbi:hypothetical protein CAPTEDRAFT_187675, partial [Capitella teleta]
MSAFALHLKTANEEAFNSIMDVYLSHKEVLRSFDGSDSLPYWCLHLLPHFREPFEIFVRIVFFLEQGSDVMSTAQSNNVALGRNFLHLVLSRMFYFLGVLEHSKSALRCLDKLIPKLRHIDESLVNAKDDFGWTPANLMFANLKVNVENSADLNRLYVELLTSFLESGLQPTEVDRHGVSLLHHAAGTGSCGALEMLIKQCGQHALNSVDSFSSTPLHFAVAATQREATEILLKSEIDKNAKDSKGRAALDLAKLFGSENIMQLLDKDCNVIHEPERQFNLHRIHKNQDTISEVEMNAVLKSPQFGSMDKQDACFQEEANRVKEEVVNWIDS